MQLTANVSYSDFWTSHTLPQPHMDLTALKENLSNVSTATCIYGDAYMHSTICSPACLFVSLRAPAPYSVGVELISVHCLAAEVQVLISETMWELGSTALIYRRTIFVCLFGWICLFPFLNHANHKFEWTFHRKCTDFNKFHYPCFLYSRNDVAVVVSIQLLLTCFSHI